MRLLGSMLPGPKDASLPSPINSDYRVLVIRYERIGDMIMATSLIRNIANALPGGQVDVLATPATAPVLEGNPYVGRIFTLNRRSIRSYTEVIKQLRQARHTVMVDGRINNPPIFTSTPLLMYAARARFRVGAHGNKKPRIYNVAVPEWNRVDHYIEGSKQLAVPFGVDPEIGSHKAAQASASYGDGRWKNQQPADIHIDAASDVRRARPVQSWRARKQETPHLQCRGAGVEPRRSLHRRLETARCAVRCRSGDRKS